MTTLDAWERPSDYGGYNPEGHLGVAAVTAASSTIEESNWRVSLKRMADAAGIETIPDLADVCESGWTCDPDKAPPVYFWEAKHWACGWVRYLMVRPDAPEGVLAEAERIKEDRESYPILDEDDFSGLEDEKVSEMWRDNSVRQRVEWIKEAKQRDYGAPCDLSIFTARHDELPFDDDGGLYDLLREWLN